MSEMALYLNANNEIGVANFDGSNATQPASLTVSWAYSIKQLNSENSPTP